MKIVRTLPLVCIIVLLSACGSDSITGPEPVRATPPPNVRDGVGTMGSGG